MQYLDAVSKMTKWSLFVSNKPFNITVIQVYDLTSNAEEAEVEWFYEDLQGDVKNRLLDSVGEGEGVMIWENSIETCILSYVKEMTSPGSMHETGCSGLVHWDDPEQWDKEGGGRGVQDGEHMYTHGWFMWVYGKNHHNIVK